MSASPIARIGIPGPGTARKKIPSTVRAIPAKIDA
jgi:hypothetical protein